MLIQPEPTIGDSSWFIHDRFGLFIHWGLYALPARHEWVKMREKIDTETYQKYFNHFDPDLYDPEQWASLASAAGMKYFVITTKHHEGFCLFDTKYTDYQAKNTPAGRDLIQPMVHAFRAKNMRVGFYHSLLDWHHPHYTVDHCHPMRENDEYIKRDADRQLEKYAEYLHGQSKELLTNYGKIDILWYDFSVSEEGGFKGKGKDVWKSERLIEMVRGLQPDILINDRLQIRQDITTPEQVQPEAWLEIDGKPVVWEACQTFSGSWGYHRDEQSWKSVEMLLSMLIDTVSKGGNMLLNVGPTGRGEFDMRAQDRLRGIGEWMRLHSRSIYGCTQAPTKFPQPTHGRYTYHPGKNRLYVHLLHYPFGNIYLENLAHKIEYAQFLNDASEIKMREPDPNETDSTKKNRLTLEIPVQKPPVTIPVIELFLKS
jgi:alpha-L-fucosidase